MLPKLSIVIPAYNVEMYIAACLDSAVNQSLKEIEIIVVNDCSPDNTEAVILPYVKADPRIKYIKHETNLGAGGARNTGMQHATAEWLTFLDPDDYVALNCYEVMIKKIEEASADMGFFGATYFEDKTNRTIMTMPFLWGRDMDTLAADAKNINAISPTVWNKIYRLQDVRANGIAFPEHLKHEDDEFLFKYFAAVEPLMVLDPTPYYYYRQRGSSIMSGVNSSRKNLPDIAANIYSFLLTKGLLAKYRLALLDRIDLYCYYLNEVDYQYRESFIKKMGSVLKSVDASEAELAPMRVVTKVLAKENIHDQLLYLLEQVDKLGNDKWYKFGQLSGSAKLRKLVAALVNKFRD